MVISFTKHIQGTRCAAINATTLALIDAGIPIRDFAVACAAGFYKDTPLLDLNYVEDSSSIPDIPVAIYPKSNKVIMLQSDSVISVENFETVIDIAIEGCQKIHSILDEKVRQRTSELLDSKGHF